MTVTITYAGQPCLDPLQARAECLRAGLPADWFGKPNSYENRLGCASGEGWLLMTRASLDAIGLDGERDLVFRADGVLIGGVVQPLAEVVCKNLHIVRADCLTPGLKGDGNATYLVELADRRRLARMTVIDESYNVRQESDLGYTSPAYYSDSLDSGGAWTWESMLEDIWGFIGTDLFGAWPGLGYSPDGAPEGFTFRSWSALDALDCVLSRLGCALAYDASDCSFFVVRVQAPDPDFEALLAARDGLRLYEEETQLTVLGRVPAYVRVRFRKARGYHNVAGYDPYYPVTIADPNGLAAGADALAVVVIDDEMTAMMGVNENGGAGAINASALNARAAERAADFFRQARGGALRRVYALPLSDFQPGSTCSKARWGDRGRGLITEVRREKIEPYSGRGPREPSPPLPALIYVSSYATPDGEGYQYGTVHRWSESNNLYLAYDDVRIKAANGDTLVGGRYYHGHPAGVAQSGNPLYVTAFACQGLQVRGYPGGYQYDGGTNAWALDRPAGDRILFWDDDPGPDVHDFTYPSTFRWLELGTNLSITGGVLNASSAATPVTVGTTTISGGSSGYLLYDNAGALGELQPAGALVVSAGTLIVTAGGIISTMLAALAVTTAALDNLAVTTGKIAADAVTLAKLQNATANSKLLGSGAAGLGADYSEIGLGGALVMSGTTLAVDTGTSGNKVPFLDGANTWAAAQSFSALNLASVSPPQITANQNNYNPTGLATAAVLLLDLDADRSLTGITAPASGGRLLTLKNTSNFTLSLVHDSASSTAANRFHFDLGSGTAYAVRTKEEITLWYDAGAALWTRFCVGLNNGNYLLASAIGTTVQAWDADLDALAALASAADKLPYFTGSHAAALADFTSAGRALVDDADAAAQRTTLGLGSAALLASDTDGLLAANSDANLPTQKAVKTYVDALSTGLKWKAPVRVATTAAGTLATSFENGDTVDGMTLATGDRILIKDQATGSENGIYVVAASGAPTRATDADSGAELVSAAVFASSGTVNADRAFVCTNDSITLGATSITFVNFLSATGALIATNNLSDVASVTTARSNLGLGTSAIIDTGTSGTKVALTDGANSWSASQTFINASGVKIKDTDGSNTLGLVGGSNLTADRTLTLTTGDASRVLTFTADATIGGTHSGTSSGTNTGDVALAGETYISISGQTITAAAVNLSGTQATGTLAAGRFPALTGPVTTAAGALPTTLVLSALTAADPALGDEAAVNNVAAGATRKSSWAKVGGLLTTTPGGRLTLTSGVPVLTSDVTGAGTIFYTPYVHNRIDLYDGTRWQAYTFSEISLALTGTLTSGKNYDLFAFDSSGAVTLEKLIWTNDTTRATDVTLQDGRYCKSGDKTRLYLGSFRATGTGTTQFAPGAGSVLLVNAYNRTRVGLICYDTVDSYTYTTATWREANASSTVGTSRVEVLLALPGDFVQAINCTLASNSSNTSFACGIGISSSSVESSIVRNTGFTNSTALRLAGVAFYEGWPGIGYYYVARLELSGAAGTTTWWGDGGGVAAQSGMRVNIWA